MSKLPRARPAPDATMVAVGKTNAPWGICGFTGSLYAMYAKYPAKRGKVINASTRTWILVEILGFLIHLRSKNDPLIKEIEAFTKTFYTSYKTDVSRNYIKNFSVDKYIERLKEKINSSIGQTKDQFLEGDYKLDIAMTPRAVADYLKFAWKQNVELHVNTGSLDITGWNNCIIGTSQTGKGTPYKGLEHYVYYDGNTVYSAGDTYSSVAEQAKDQFNWNTVHEVYAIVLQ